MIRAAILLLCVLFAAPAPAALSARELAGAVARPPVNAILPSNLVFTDTQARRATLPQVAEGRPLVLIFADFTCQHICRPALTIAAASLHSTGLTAGRDYRLAVVGIDPRDSIADATHFARAIAGVPDVLHATRLLRGDRRTVAAATRALGYAYVYDASSDQFAHDASIYVFAADGSLSALLPELGLQPAALRRALAGDKPAPTPGWAAQVAHLCYGLAAAHGRFGRPIVLGLQALSLLLLCFAGVLLWRRRRPA